MSGSVSRSGGGWQFVIDAGLDAHGKRRQHRRRGFATKKLAQEAMVEAQCAALYGELVTCGRRTRRPGPATPEYERSSPSGSCPAAR